MRCGSTISIAWNLTLLKKKLKIVGKRYLLDEKYLRVNKASFVTKESRKTIKASSKMCNEYLKRKMESY